ncbi:(A+T)-stretch binding protein [Haematobia irritans]|uniref:(A+T)-stretch binding protein n=1 Tax=Haematobia irritans TaxID=7368 RepID=UPI003F504825
MGFPRIISKNNKIYTKLGDFCLSGDGNQFWILCHVCQEELQTQDKFWKHIQDEHNFMHGMRQEQTRAAQAYMEAAEAASMMPLPLFRKMSVNEQQREDSMSQEDEDMQKEPKDYTEMRAHDDPNQSVAIDIKLEPQLSHQGQHQQHQHQQQQQQQQEQQDQMQQQQQQQQQTQQIEISTPLMYQIPHVHAPPVSAYAALVQAPNLNSLNMSVAAAAAASQVPTSMAALMPIKDEMVHKESANNSTTASASSAMSSEDGERWYICDFENCGLKFKYQSRLELHRSVHSKERRFSCEICGASFKQSCNLSTHRKKKHALKGTAKMTLVPPHRF